MSRTNSSLLGFLLLVFAQSLMAQHGAQVPYERVLLPVAIATPVPGAYGSVWTTQITARNDAEEPVEITATPVSLCTQCPPVEAHRTFVPSFVVADPNAGQFIYVGNPGRDNVTIDLRVQDISRQSQTWGTEIPVVREKDVRASTIHLLDIPVDSHFRSALRVYDFDTPANGALRLVRVRIFTMCGIAPLDANCGDSPVAEDVLNLQPNAVQSSPAYPDHPGAFMIGDLVGRFPQLADVPPSPLAGGGTRPAAIRIDIEPMTPGLRFWAMVSATNNETQHVTVIAPD